jgi:hypothetical protein
VAGLADGSAEKAAALAALSHLLFYHGDSAEAEEMATAALTIAEPLQKSRTIVEAFGTLAMVRTRHQGRLEEGIALLQRALELALKHELTNQALPPNVATGDGSRC